MRQAVERAAEMPPAKEREKKEERREKERE